MPQLNLHPHLAPPCTHLASHCRPAASTPCLPLQASSTHLASHCRPAASTPCLPLSPPPFPPRRQAFAAVQSSTVHLLGVSSVRRFALVPLGPPLLSYSSNSKVGQGGGRELKPTAASLRGPCALALEAHTRPQHLSPEAHTCPQHLSPEAHTRSQHLSPEAHTRSALRPMWISSPPPQANVSPFPPLPLGPSVV